MKKLSLLMIALLIFNACSKNETDQKSATSSTSQTATVSKNQPGPAPTRQISQQNKKNLFVSYAPIETQKLINQRTDLLIIDVRNPNELREGKIKNSVLLPFWNIMKGNHQLPRDKPLLLVCAVGGRSYAAMQVLSKQGFTEIYNLKGGISAWKSLKLPVVY